MSRVEAQICRAANYAEGRDDDDEGTAGSMTLELINEIYGRTENNRAHPTSRNSQNSKKGCVGTPVAITWRHRTTCQSTLRLPPPPPRAPISAVFNEIIAI